VRNGGVKCLGLFGLLDVKYAKIFLPLFAEVLLHDRAPLKMTTLKILFDLLMVFGVDEMKSADGKVNGKTSEEQREKKGAKFFYLFFSGLTLSLSLFKC
jgi:hypothetical protein